MNIYLHHGLDRWFEGVVKPHCRGKALLIRYADDFVCAFQYREDAEAFYRVLPKRLARFGLEVAPEKTRLLRFARFHPGMWRRFAFLGFEFYWSVDRQGERRLGRRTARKKLGRALKEFSDWVRTHRHLPTKELFRQVAWKLGVTWSARLLPRRPRRLSAPVGVLTDSCFLLNWLLRVLSAPLFFVAARYLISTRDFPMPTGTPV